MDPTAAESPPGCLVLLLRLSADMTAEVVTGRGESVAFASARFLADELIEGLVNTAAAGYAIGAIDVAVLGYRAAEDASPQLVSLLPDGDPKPRLVPLARVAEMPAEARAAEGQPRKWSLLPACEGQPCAAQALASVYQMVGMWLTGRYANRPPVVIHCTGAEGLDDAYFRIARSLSLLSTGHGPARLLHYVFDNQGDQGPLAAYWELLHEVSAILPENADAGKPARRGAWVNDWDLNDQWDALFTYAWQQDGVAWAEAGAAFHPGKAMWTQKMGNSPEQWEDAFAVDEASGVAAVADGASTGIYCRTWADQLSTRFLADRPETRDPVALNNWVNGLRTVWRSAINYSSLNWSKQAKVDQVGAAATLLGLELGPPDAEGNRPWRACAVGDASLFWVRGGQLLASFPVVADNQFGSAPLLVRSSPGFKTLAVHAAGSCRPSDRFVLATDAVAARLFKVAGGGARGEPVGGSTQQPGNGPGVDWSRFEHITEDDWRAELDTLRTANDMVNDDCTLVVLRVSGGSEEPERTEDRGQRTEDSEEGKEPEQAPSTLSSDFCPLSSDQGANAPRSPGENESAARDGFPESTDTRD
jgi:hypothetical protein